MIIETLQKRRNEIATQIRAMQTSLTHIDATIKLFQEDYVAPKKTYKMGVTRAIFDVLRNSDKPLTNNEIAVRINIDAKRVGIALNAQQKKGLVIGKRDGAYSLWEIAHHP